MRQYKQCSQPKTVYFKCDFLGTAQSFFLRSEKGLGLEGQTMRGAHRGKERMLEGKVA
jgi:hypothetical protein